MAPSSCCGLRRSEKCTRRREGCQRADGGLLATAGHGDGTVRLWDLATFGEVAVLRGHRDYVHAVAFSPDGSRLVSSSGDYSVRIWHTLPSNHLE